MADLAIDELDARARELSLGDSASAGGLGDSVGSAAHGMRNVNEGRSGSLEAFAEGTPRDSRSFESDERAASADLDEDSRYVKAALVLLSLHGINVSEPIALSAFVAYNQLMASKVLSECMLLQNAAVCLDRLTYQILSPRRRCI
jgi:hypothetical protein